MSWLHEIKKHSLKDKYIQAPKSIASDAKQTPLVSCAPYSNLCGFEVTWRAVVSSMGVVFVDKLKSVPWCHIPSDCFPSPQSRPLQFNFEKAAKKNFLKCKSN